MVWICELNGYANLKKYPELKFNRPQEAEASQLKIYQEMEHSTH